MTIKDIYHQKSDNYLQKLKQSSSLSSVSVSGWIMNTKSDKKSVFKKAKISKLGVTGSWNSQVSQKSDNII